MTDVQETLAPEPGQEGIDIAALQAEVVGLGQRVTTLTTQQERTQQALNARARELEIIAEMLREEAESRDWCDEYGTFVDKVNRACGRDVLQHCSRTYTVSVDLTIAIEASNEEAAREAARSLLRDWDGSDNEGLSYDIGRAERN